MFDNISVGKTGRCGQRPVCLKEMWCGHKSETRKCGEIDRWEETAGKTESKDGRFVLTGRPSQMLSDCLGWRLHSTFIKETSSDQSLVDKGKSTCFQLGSYASNKHNGELSSNESQGGWEKPFTWVLSEVPEPVDVLLTKKTGVLSSSYFRLKAVFTSCEWTSSISTRESNARAACDGLSRQSEVCLFAIKGFCCGPCVPLWFNRSDLAEDCTYITAAPHVTSLPAASRRPIFSRLSDRCTNGSWKHGPGGWSSARCPSGPKGRQRS